MHILVLPAVHPDINVELRCRVSGKSRRDKILERQITHESTVQDDVIRCDGRIFTVRVYDSFPLRSLLGRVVVGFD